MAVVDRQVCTNTFMSWSLHTQKAASMTESVMDPPQVSPSAHISMSSDRAEERMGTRQRGKVKAADGKTDKNL